MTRKEWTDRAKEYYAKARAAYAIGDTITGNDYMHKADACMANADYGTEGTEVEWPRKLEA